MNPNKLLQTIILFLFRNIFTLTGKSRSSSKSLVSKTLIFDITHFLLLFIVRYLRDDSLCPITNAYMYNFMKTYLNC